MTYPNNVFLNQLSSVVTVIPPKYVDALLVLHKKIGEDIKWVVNGDLAECLRTVQVEPDCIEIVTSKQDVEKIYQAVQEFKPTQMVPQVLRLPRNAVIEDKDYPVYTRSRHFEFNLKGVKVEVQGDLQFRVGDWDWGDTFEFTPEYVYVVGKKTAVTPLPIAAEFYQTLGWTDRADKVKQVLQRPLHAKEQR